MSSHRLQRLTPWAVRVTVGDLAAADATGSPLPDLPATPGPDRPGVLGVEALGAGAGPPALAWSVDGRPAGADHPVIGYSTHRGRARHVRVQAGTDVHYGLGECSGPLVKTGRRITWDPRDACAYDTDTGDPLYKHWPVVLTRHHRQAWTALVYDQPHPMTASLGAERHHYHGLYTFVEASTTWWRYVLVGATGLPALLERLTLVLGRPDLPPRWALGYLASGMAYTDADDPAAALRAFAARVRAEQVPCDAVHLSSGFGLRDGRRYTLTWNPDRVPDPAALLADLRAAGLRSIINVKPALLTDHPAHPGLAAAGAFLRDEDGAPALAPYWGGAASWLDFTSPAAVRWWREQVRATVLDVGADGVWNDNNEYALAPDTRDSTGAPAHAATQILAMAQASAAELDARADRTGQRGLLVTRSASLGVHRLAQTWSGDNSTDWPTLDGNTAMGLSLGLSGYAANGHDIGGFHGPDPGPELFLRWAQRGIGYPRFSIHSWKPGPTEPWTHPAVADAVADAIRLRYRLIPYLYSLYDEHRRTGAPVQRPLVLEFPDRYLDPGRDAMLGPWLLVPAVGAGRDERDLDLPGAWFDWHTGQRFEGPSVLPTPLQRAPLLVRAGAIIPVATRIGAGTADLDATRELLLFPGRGRTRFTHYEDDGVSLDHRGGAWTRFTVTMTAGPDRIEVGLDVEHHGYPLPYPELTVRVAVPDPRPLTLAGSWDGLTVPVRVLARP